MNIIRMGSNSTKDIARKVSAALASIVQQIVEGHKIEMRKFGKPSAYLGKEDVDGGDPIPHHRAITRLSSYCQERPIFFPALCEAYRSTIGRTYPNGLFGMAAESVSIHMPEELRAASSLKTRNEDVEADLSSALSRLSPGQRNSEFSALLLEIAELKASLPTYKDAAVRHRPDPSQENYDEIPRNDSIGNSGPAPRPPPSFR